MKITPKQPREAALNALCAIRRRKDFAADALAAAAAEMDERDAAFCTHLTLCVLQNRRLIDAAIRRFAGERKIEPLVMELLRLGAAQLLFMRVPKNAAVDETVKQARAACPRAAGFCNAVLRRISETDADTLAGSLGGGFALRYGLPDWFAEELTACLGHADAERFAETVSVPPPVTLIESPFRPLTAREKQPLEPHPFLPGAYLYDGSVERLPGFIRGKVLAADAGARMAVMALGLQPGQRVWDACAAPGGKSLMAALDMGNTGKILSTDLSEKKLPKITGGAVRMGVTILETKAVNAALHDPGALYDAVICDVPCSGLGVIAKKPDIRDKSPSDFTRLPDLQGRILRNTARFVKPGGLLLYCTCTFRRGENEDVVNAFLQDNAGFSKEAFTIPIGEISEGEITLFPHIHHTDGFYICLLRRTENR